MMDKYIKLNLKLISGEIGAAAVMALASLLCLANILMAFIIIVIPIIALLVVIRAYKKLFWDGIYGKSAYLYNSLPLNTEEIVAGKLFAAWIMLLAYNLAAVCTILILLFAGDGMFSMMTDVMSGSKTTLIGVIAGQIDVDMMQLVLPVELLKAVTGTAVGAAIMFFGVVFANSQKGSGSKSVRVIGAIILCIALAAVLTDGIGTITARIGIDYSVWLSLLQCIVNVVSVEILFKVIVNLMNKYYILK